jgi:hypothetical protein
MSNETCGWHLSLRLVYPANEKHVAAITANQLPKALAVTAQNTRMG